MVRTALFTLALVSLLSCPKANADDPEKAKRIKELQAEIIKTKAKLTELEKELGRLSPPVSGDWQEGDHVIVRITQDGAKFVAECSYVHPQAGEINWRMEGTISLEGKIEGTLIHTKAPDSWQKKQVRKGQVQGDVINLIGEIDGGGSEKLTWKRITKSSETENNPALVPGASDAELFDPETRDRGATIKLLDELAALYPPIVQDKERMKELRAAYMEWNRKFLVGPFDRHNPKGGLKADKAREALQIKAEELALDSLSELPVQQYRSNAALDAAVATGCSDPILLYFQFRQHFDQGRIHPEQYLQRIRDVALTVWKSDYPDIWKLSATHVLIVTLDPNDEDQQAELRTWEPRYWEVFERVCKDPDSITQHKVMKLAGFFEESKVNRGRARDVAYREIAEHLEKGKAPEYTQLATKGEFLMHYAWDARGAGFADTVTEMGARLMRERLQEAETALTAAYKLDPKRYEAPTTMLTVCMGLGHDRTTMEKWFTRSMTANPFNGDACSRKLEYLHPKWHGSAKEWLGFGWQCVRTKNVDGRLPLATLNNYLANVPLRVVVTEHNFKKLDSFYGEPRIYHILHAAISLTLRDSPDLKGVRGSHIRMACLASDFKVAKEEMGRFKGDFERSGFSASEVDWYTKWIETKKLPPLLRWED